MTKRIPTIARPACLLALALGLCGCMPGYRPGGGQTSMDAYTYESTINHPQTVKVLDLGTGAVLWSMDVPVGRQLIIRFYEDADVKNERCPALMRWELRGLGDQWGELDNSIPVPRADLRKVDVFHRPTPTATPLPEAAGAY